MGWSGRKLGEASEQFVTFAAVAGGPVLDIGAGYGAACRAAFEAGAVRVIANDIDARHVEALDARFEIKIGRFPREIEFEDGSLAAIHAANVFHFLSPRQLTSGLRKIERWLRPGGKLFVQAASPYQSVWGAFPQEYLRRVEAGQAFPGVMEKVSDYVTHRMRGEMPRSIHLMDEVILRREAEAAGLVVERAWLYRWRGLPRELTMDGREMVGLIARKVQREGH